MIGISPYCFVWNLSPGETFQSPEAALVYSAEGLGGMSHGFHRLFMVRARNGFAGQ
jgi:alpha-galactosidase